MLPGEDEGLGGWGEGGGAVEDEGLWGGGTRVIDLLWGHTY